MRALFLCVFLTGCFDPTIYNQTNIKIDAACKAAGLLTMVSIGGDFLCRPPEQKKPACETEGEPK